MLLGDKIYLGSTEISAAYLDSTIVYGAIPPYAANHIARVIADGGTVPDEAELTAIVSKLVTTNLWSKCVLFGMPSGGLKKDSNQYINKLYDVKGNADFQQTTGTQQPKYNSLDESVISENDDKMNIPVPVPTALKLLNTFTIMCWILLPSVHGSSQGLFGRGRQGILTGFLMPTSSLLPEFWVIDSVNLIVKKVFYSQVAVTANTWCQLALTYNASEMDGAVEGLLKCYINGVPVAVTKNTNLNYNNNLINTDGYGIMDLPNYSALPMCANSKITLPQVYNVALTDAEILSNYNNIRPKGV